MPRPKPRNAALDPAPTWLKTLNVIALVILVGWILYDALGRNVFGSTSWPQSVVDYQILYEHGHRIAVRLRYDPTQIFPYAPPAALMFALTALPPFAVAAGVWLAILTASAIGVFVLGTDLVGLRGNAARWIVALLTYVVTNNYFQWDLRSVNCNSVYAVLLVGAMLCVARSRNTWGGTLLAASIALKLYPVLALPYLLWIKKWRAAFATIACLLAFFVIAPLLYAGPNGFVQLYRSWLEQLRVATATDLKDHPILISIPHGLAKVLGADSQAAAWIASGATVAWVGVVGLCLLSGGLRRKGVRTGWDLCVDAFALVLLPIVVSPYLESYHVVVAAPPILALLAYGVLRSSDLRRLTIAVLVVLAGWGLLYALGKWKLRGLGVLAQMSLVFLALAAARIDIRRQERRASTAHRGAPVLT
ncbi:MAG: DUF2029 domain-containing protein [Phycisphaeraceae bacterium]|nr:DUF2029 domain-containing protein [Phycisphaeraceae bacterium]